MPIYEYRCTKCEHVFDCVQRVGDPAPACPQCGSPTRRVYSSVGLIFKGKGFHTTDYRKPAPTGDGESTPADSQAGRETAGKESSADSSGSRSGPKPKGSSDASSTTKESSTSKDSSPPKKASPSKGGTTSSSGSSE
jgi:putative FmdB family regulatory protein